MPPICPSKLDAPRVKRSRLVPSATLLPAPPVSDPRENDPAVTALASSTPLPPSAIAAVPPLDVPLNARLDPAPSPSRTGPIVAAPLKASACPAATLIAWSPPPALAMPVPVMLPRASTRV